MGKIINRISHYITKGIPMESSNKPNQTICKKETILNTNESKGRTKNKNQISKYIQPTREKKNKLQRAINEEAIYAGTPTNKYSEVVERIKMEEVEKLRRITERGRKRRKKKN